MQRRDAAGCALRYWRACFVYKPEKPEESSEEVEEKRPGPKFVFPEEKSGCMIVKMYDEVNQLINQSIAD